MSRKLRFLAIGEDGTAGTGEGEDGWVVELDGQIVIEELLDTELSYAGLDDLWRALGVDAEWVWQ